jgi:hypothetical protein
MTTFRPFDPSREKLDADFSTLSSWCNPDKTDTKQIDKPTSESIGKLTGEPIGKPTGEPIGKPTGEPIGKPTGEPIGKPTGEPIREDKSQPDTATTDAPDEKSNHDPIRNPERDHPWNREFQRCWRETTTLQIPSTPYTLIVAIAAKMLGDDEEPKLQSPIQNDRQRYDRQVPVLVMAYLNATSLYAFSHDAALLKAIQAKNPFVQCGSWADMAAIFDRAKYIYTFQSSALYGRLRKPTNWTVSPGQQHSVTSPDDTQTGCCSEQRMIYWRYRTFSLFETLHMRRKFKTTLNQLLIWNPQLVPTILPAQIGGAKELDQWYRKQHYDHLYTSLTSTLFALYPLSLTIYHRTRIPIEFKDSKGTPHKFYTPLEPYFS